MKSIYKVLMAITVLLSVATANAQSKNKVTQTVKINGSCSMCKKIIETAANTKSAVLNWNEDTKTAVVTYNPKKTNLDEILKRVADAGYDNEKFSATTTAYNDLHRCCQYDREAPKKAECHKE
ncbi:heavy-metal-associated domain-containing protein [Flavobacterium poyangense]|uniref:heavy-metal-associated domain-containing protein n=1 Tax=Flavobacterium poyangense TaxID=2204302 RepID=UPI001422DBFA|nr:copper chaperone [Flavobacterium sp. JXAS1]